VIVAQTGQGGGSLEKCHYSGCAIGSGARCSGQACLLQGSPLEQLRRKAQRNGRRSVFVRKRSPAVCFEKVAVQTAGDWAPKPARLTTLAAVMSDGTAALLRQLSRWAAGTLSVRFWI
jgi:hypothetical protein